MNVSRGTLDARFAEMVAAENERQNLISANTIGEIRLRHFDDSFQLVDLAPPEGRWLDIGTGAGFPGMVVAIHRYQPTDLVEPRAMRADFLARAASALGLSHVTVHKSRAESLPAASASVISARAVAALPKLLSMTHRHAAPGCVWLLPKGRTAAQELAEAQCAWQGDFRLIPSRTDPEASIVMIRDLAPRHTERRR